MPRVARKDLNTPFLHMMIQGVNKEYIFNSKRDVEKYLEIFNKCRTDYNFTLIAFCIMNNHAHFLIYAENISEIGKFMHKVNLKYAKMYNKEKKRCGVLFRNRFQTEPIYDIKYLVNCIKYIHNNPVKAGIVQKCEDYEYSSYKDYINNNGLTQSQIMQEIFGNKCNYIKLFQSTYDKRVMDIDDEKCEDAEKYIVEGIREYKEAKDIRLIDILSNKKIFIDMICFMKEKCNIKYQEIQKYFGISKKAMYKLKKNEKLF